MKVIRSCLVSSIILAILMGCAPKRLPEEREEKVPLSRALAAATRRFEGVNSLQTALFLKVQVQEEFHLLRGFLLYERLANVRLRLSSPLGQTVGEVLYCGDLLHIFLPTLGRVYMGPIREEDLRQGETLFITMTYKDYEEVGGRRLPTRIYGEVEGGEVWFDLRLKDPKVNVSLPEGAFVARTAGWEVHPLEELRGLLSRTGAQEGP